MDAYYPPPFVPEFETVFGETLILRYFAWAVRSSIKYRLSQKTQETLFFSEMKGKYLQTPTRTVLKFCCWSEWIEDGIGFSTMDSTPNVSNRCASQATFPDVVVTFCVNFWTTSDIASLTTVIHFRDSSSLPSYSKGLDEFEFDPIRWLPHLLLAGMVSYFIFPFCF